MAGLLEISTNDFVTTIRMNRPPVNALVPELQEELVEALDRVKDDAATRVVVLTSAIDRYFMAGADIKAMGGDGGFDRENPATLERVAQMSRRSQAAFSEVEHFPKPLIAAINGHALGGGCELALAKVLIASPFASPLSVVLVASVLTAFPCELAATAVNAPTASSAAAPAAIQIDRSIR